MSDRGKERACLFIQDDEGGVFVQRPTSVFAGLARHRWLQQYFGEQRVHIASPARWQLLQETYESKLLFQQPGEDFRVKER